MSADLAMSHASGNDQNVPEALLALGRSLSAEQRYDAAVTVLDHLLSLAPARVDILKDLLHALGAKGATIEAVQRLVVLRASCADVEPLIPFIREQALVASEKYNALLATREIEQAEHYASALATLLPGSVPMLEAALSCNLSLGRPQRAALFAQALLALDPAHAGAKAVLSQLTATKHENGNGAPESQQDGTRALVQLRDLHDAASAILCRPLDAPAVAELETLLRAAATLAVDVPWGSELSLWERHYRLLLDAVDLAALTQDPVPQSDSDTAFLSSTGEPLDWAGVRETAARLGAKAIFFTAADEAYVDLYARWYALSVLKNADVPSLVIVHVIGGAGQLPRLCREIGVADERLIFASDRFIAGAVTTRCYDAPPKGLSAKPIAHLQSARFLRLPALIEQLKLPVFVSDIDLILQRGVRDLLMRATGQDVVFNENEASSAAGSRVTANLLLVNPTENAAAFARFLRAYLERALAKRAVTRWVDQVALLMARHYLARRTSARFDLFDTRSDINNVMYPSYRENPFRFLSLFHGFDMASLEPLAAGLAA